MLERYAAGPEASHAGSPERDAPSSMLLVVLDVSHDYHLRITARPQERRCDLEAVNSKLPRDAPLLDGPTILRPDQPPDPRTANLSGIAGRWHPGHALYCLPRWAQLRWPHTREYSAEWSFHLDGRQQGEAIPPKEGGKSPTAMNLCPVFAIHQILALATEGQATMYTGSEARAAYGALVSEIFSALSSALIRHPANPRMP